MCYHLSVNKSKSELEKRFQSKFNQPKLWKKIYYANSFELPQVPVITEDEPGQIQMFTWGLIPFWVKNREQAELKESQNQFKEKVGR